MYSIDLVPSPSDMITSFRGMSVRVGGSFRRVKGWAHPREMQPIRCLRDSADRFRRGGGWLVEDGVPRYVPFPSSNLVVVGRWRHARGREHCRGESCNALSGGHAPDSARAEGSSIVD